MSNGEPEKFDIYRGGTEPSFVETPVKTVEVRTVP
jgi:hypothetical protein